MNRRDTVVALLALAAAPLAARAQPTQQAYRIGFLSAYPRELSVAVIVVLRELGYEEGRNTVFDYRFAEGREDRLAALAGELVASKVDLIIAPSNPDILAAKHATTTIPIVMMFSLAPAETGLVASLARPGGNVTGTTIQAPEHGGKLLEVLRDAVPRISRVTYVWEPEFPGLARYRDEAERAGKAMGIRLTGLPARTLAELEAALAQIARDRPDALYIVPSGAILTHRARILEFAARQRLPAIYPNKQIVAEGGLISYAADRAALVRRTAEIIDRILKGANPADLPVEQPTKYEMAINLKAAKALGIAIPQSVLLRADEVIQ